MEIGKNFYTDLNNAISDPEEAIADYAISYKDIPLLDTTSTSQDKAIEIFKAGAQSGVKDRYPIVKYRFDCPFSYNDPNGKSIIVRAQDLGIFNTIKGAAYDKCDGGEVEGVTSFSYTKAKNWDMFAGCTVPTTPTVRLRFEETKIVSNNIYLDVKGSVTIAIKCKNADGSKTNIDIVSVPLFFTTNYNAKLKAGTCKIKYVFGIPGEFQCERYRVPKEIEQNGQKRTELIGLWRTADGTDLVDIFENGTYAGVSQDIIEYNPEIVEFLAVGGQEIKRSSFDKRMLISLITQCAISSIDLFEKGLNKEKWVRFGGDAEAFEQISCQNNFFEAASLNILETNWLIGKDAAENNIITINNSADIP